MYKNMTKICMLFYTNTVCFYVNFVVVSQYECNYY
jgi:hypothetical protein